MRVPNPLLWLLAASVLAPPALGQDIRPGGPTSAGVRAAVDIPATQHIRNVGGSDGAGLCVPTSCELASRWQSAALAGFQAWCTKRPGGSYPEKLEQYIVQFCREQRREIPHYVQHTGGDETLLDLAIRTGRCPCITYAGRDDFYGNQVIAHMVLLAHLDSEKAAILDNNRPGVWVWMSRKQLLDRWRGVDQNGRPLTVPTLRGPMQVGGGWCVIFLEGPPPPYSVKPAEEFTQAGGQVMYGQCQGGTCPVMIQPFQPLTTPAPVQQTVRYPDEYNRAAEEVLAGTRVVLVVGPPPTWFRDGDTTAKVFRSPTFSAVADGVYSCWLEDGGPKMKPITSATDLPVGQVGQKVEPKAIPAKPTDGNFGVDLEKMQAGKRWFHNGAETSKEEVLAAVAGNLIDDSDKWFLILVGPPSDQAAFAAAVKQILPEQAAKLHVKVYSSADWQVTQFALPVGVSIRKAARGRVGEEAGRFAGELNGDTLKRFVADSFAPPPKPMPPTPAPQPTPGPQPEPSPTPAPEPTPPTPFGIPMWLLAVVAAAVTYLLTRRK